MRILLILTFICGLMAQAPIRSFQEDSAQVTRILTNERNRSQAKVSQTFVVTDETLRALKNQGLPENVLTSLSSIKDKQFNSEDKFLNVLEEKLGKEDSKTFQSAILTRSRRSLKVDPAFVDEVRRRVLQAEASQPKGKEINEDLEEQHRRFLKNIISFAEKEEGTHNEINLTVDLLGKYAGQTERCNENPCPGCPCKNCRRKC